MRCVTSTSNNCSNEVDKKNKRQSFPGEKRKLWIKAKGEKRRGSSYNIIKKKTFLGINDPLTVMAVIFALANFKMGKYSFMS